MRLAGDRTQCAHASFRAVDPGFNSEDYEKDTEADSQSEPGSDLEPGSDDDGNSDADSQYDSQNDSDDGEPHVGTAQNTRARTGVVLRVRGGVSNALSFMCRLLLTKMTTMLRRLTC